MMLSISLPKPIIVNQTRDFIEKKAMQSAMKLKKKIRQILKTTPLISDYYDYYWLFPRCANLFRGVYSSFSEALEDIPHGIGKSYDGIRNFQQIDVEAETIELETIDPDDYYLLKPLQKAFLDSFTLFDLGGNKGKAYYSYKKYIAYPESLRWIVCELPGAVEIGKSLKKALNSQNLFFTTDFYQAEQADILLTSGTLQYLQPSLSELLSQLKSKPLHIIVNRVPFYEGEEYVTLQNFIDTYVPYKIQNRTQFINSMNKLGYELIDTWQKDRVVNIPFHPECFVNAYYGFYLKLKF